jgi:hypothetical protein
LGLGGGTSSYGLTAGAGAGAGALDGVLYDAAGPQHDTAGEQHVGCGAQHELACAQHEAFAFLQHLAGLQQFLFASAAFPEKAKRKMTNTIPANLRMATPHSPF